MARPQPDPNQAKTSLINKLLNATYEEPDQTNLVPAISDVFDTDDLRMLMLYVQQSNSSAEVFAARMCPNPRKQEGA